jgi:cytoskeletal protein CcmA (bactofilin family)
MSAEHVELRAGARVIGKIDTAKIVMAEGCILQGEVLMPRKEDKPFVFVEKRKGEGNQGISPEEKEMNESESKSVGQSKKNQS